MNQTIEKVKVLFTLSNNYYHKPDVEYWLFLR